MRSDRGRRSSVQFIKQAIKVIQSVRKICVGSRSVLGRRLVVDNDLQILPNVLRVVGGEILLKLVTVFGLAGLGGLFRCISRFLVFVFVIVFVRILFRL